MEWSGAVSLCGRNIRSIRQSNPNLPSVTGAKGERILGALYPT